MEDLGLVVRIRAEVTPTKPSFTQDARGTFTKVFNGNADGFSARQVFWSESQQGVVRGMHFQAPPHDCERLVFVVRGAVRDFVIDLREGSEGFGQIVENSLTEKSGSIIVPPYAAHGFEVVSESALVVYLFGAAHFPEYDTGICPLTLGIHYRSDEVCLSRRDRDLPSWSSFVSPFGVTKGL